MRKKEVTVLSALFLIMAASVVNAISVGETFNKNVQVSCPSVVLDNDISDGSTTSIFYEYELVDPTGDVRFSSGLLQHGSNSKLVTCSFVSDEAGTWTCSANMITQTTTWDGSQWQVSGGVCDSESSTQEVSPAPVCGNGIIEGTEECDGGTDCSQSCEIIIAPEQTPEGTEIYYPVDDAKVGSSQPTTNFGNGVYIMVKDKHNAKDRGYYEFDLSGTSSNAVSSASFSTPVFYTDSNAVGTSIQAWYCDNHPFDESTITWNNQPASWTTVSNEPLTGCSLAATHMLTTNVVYGAASPSGGEVWHSWDLTSTVNSELLKDKKFTIVLKYPSELSAYPYHYSWYLSKENSEAAYRPKLEIS
jgi:hypothetical protein